MLIVKYSCLPAGVHAAQASALEELAAQVGVTAASPL